MAPKDAVEENMTALGVDDPQEAIQAALEDGVIWEPEDGLLKRT